MCWTLHTRFRTNGVLCFVNLKPNLLKVEAKQLTFTFECKPSSLVVWEFTGCRCFTLLSMVVYEPLASQLPQQLSIKVSASHRAVCRTLVRKKVRAGKQKAPTRPSLPALQEPHVLHSSWIHHNQRATQNKRSIPCTINRKNHYRYISKFYERLAQWNNLTCILYAYASIGVMDICEGIYLLDTSMWTGAWWLC